MKILFCLILVLVIHINEASRILCLFPFNGRSHFKMFETLCKGLAKRGHKIDMISHFPLSKPVANYTDIIDLRGSRKTMVNSFTVSYGQQLQKALTYYIATDFGGAFCDLMEHESMQKFIKNSPNNPPYDLIITEYFGSPCYIGYGELLKTPVAIIISFLPAPHVNDFMGNPQEYAFFPCFHTDEAKLDSFSDRFWNLFTCYTEMLKYRYYTMDQTEKARKYLHLPDMPDIRELEKKVSLALVNSHHSFYGIKSTVPSIIDVGGLHINDEDSTLSPKFKDWLDSADHGLVYFTLGSLMNIETFPKEIVLNIYASLAKISPVKVLMKCVNTTKLPPGLPANVMTFPWVSQVAVLKHKNTRVFITHGGLMGTQEAVYYGIPMIGIPVFADQMKNVNILVHKNMAVSMNLENINEQTLDAALNAILYDPKYRESAKRTSSEFRDRPLNAMDTAAFWIEYVIRNGANSLKSPAVDLPWWKLNLIDVFAFLLACFILTILSLSILLKIVFRHLCTTRFQAKKKVN